MQVSPENMLISILKVYAPLFPTNDCSADIPRGLISALYPYIVGCCSKDPWIPANNIVDPYA